MFEDDKSIALIISFWIRSSTNYQTAFPNELVRIIQTYYPNQGVYSTKNNICQYGQNTDALINVSDGPHFGIFRINVCQHRTIKHVPAGYAHSMFIDDKNIAWCCGWNEDG